MRFEIYTAKDGCRWRLVAKNGRIVADSGEAYKSEGNARRAMKAFRHNVTSAPVVVIKSQEGSHGDH
jgi:uncharacterized protein YegP (UPF0339 family)